MHLYNLAQASTNSSFQKSSSASEVKMRMTQCMHDMIQYAKEPKRNKSKKKAKTKLEKLFHTKRNSTLSLTLQILHELGLCLPSHSDLSESETSRLCVWF